MADYTGKQWYNAGTHAYNAGTLTLTDVTITIRKIELQENALIAFLNLTQASIAQPFKGQCTYINNTAEENISVLIDQMITTNFPTAVPVNDEQ